MKKHYSLLTFITILFFGQLQAETYIVTFGDAAGLTYSPNQVEAIVGDTVLFQGNFVAHPLSSTSVPSGASDFSYSSTDTELMVVLNFSGTYNYQCDFHFSAGMVGSINVSEDPLRINTVIKPNNEISMYPNPSQGLLNITNNSNDINFASVYSLDGKLVNAIGVNNSPLLTMNLSALPAGCYLVVLKLNNGEQIRRNIFLN